MAIGRTEFQVAVTGVEDVERGFSRVAEAEKKLGQSGPGALKRLEDSLEHVTGPAGKVLRVFNDVGDVFRLFAAGIAGGALFGGLQDIAEALKAMYDAAQKVLDVNLWKQSQDVQKYLDGIAKAAEAAAKAQLDLIAAQEKAGATGAIRALDILGGGADPAAVSQVMRITRDLTELEQRRLDLAQDRAKFESSGAADELVRLQQQIEAKRRELRGFTEVGANIAPPSARAAAREQSLAEVVGGIAAQSNPRAAMQAGALGTIDAEIARQEAARMAELERFATINDQRNAMALAHMQSIEAEAPKMADAFKMVGDSFDGMTGRMVSSATDAAGIVTQAIGAITGALGGMVTNMIIAGDAGAKGMAKQAGNVLASLSAQAFGYSILLEGMALAAVFIPGLQLSAPGLAKAGAVMAGIGAALGISARALGAEKLGGGGGGRSAAGGGGAGGGGGNPAAGTNPAAGQSERPVYVSVQIGDEPVMGIVRRANEREARRGGMSGHFAMAGG